MLKKIIILSSILTIAGCSSKQSQCDPEKNYVKSNPELVSEYFRLESEGKIKSIYYENNPSKPCVLDSCANFNYEKFDYVERKYSGDVYTIKVKNDFNKIENNCMDHHPLYKKLENKCFYLEKNLDNQVISIYKKIYTYKENQLNIKMYKRDELIFEYQSHFYKNQSFGGYGGGLCGVKSNNKNFNVFSIGQ